MLIVHQLTRILLDMDALDTDDLARAVRIFLVQRHLDFALADDRVVQLRNLVALRQIGVKIILPVEPGIAVDLRVDRHAGADRLADALTVRHGQHARHCGVDEAHMAVRFPAISGRRARKELGFRCDLRMDLKADHDLPLTGYTLDAVFAHITTTSPLPP